MAAAVSARCRRSASPCGCPCPSVNDQAAAPRGFSPYRPRRRSQKLAVLALKNKGRLASRPAARRPLGYERARLCTAELHHTQVAASEGWSSTSGATPSPGICPEVLHQKRCLPFGSGGRGAHTARASLGCSGAGASTESPPAPAASSFAHAGAASTSVTLARPRSPCRSRSSTTVRTW